MTQQETIKVLALLKAAYPNSYKNMSKEETELVLKLWATQFCDVPGDIVIMAVIKAISCKVFPPAIAEVRESLRQISYEAQADLVEHQGKLTDKEAAYLTRIANYDSRRIGDVPLLEIMRRERAKIE